MDSGVRYSIRAQDLTDEAFAPYGDIIKPRMSGENCGHVKLPNAERQKKTPYLGIWIGG